MLDGGSIVRCLRLLLLSRDRKIVYEADPIAGGHRRDFVLAVGVERGVLCLELGIRASEIDLLRLAVVLDDQGPAFVVRRQTHDQRGKHARRFLRVAMGGEETALLVDEQLVEVCA